MRTALLKLMLVIWAILAITTPARAGGMHIRDESVRFNGRETLAVRPGASVQLEFDAVEYEFGAQRYKYFVFVMARGKRSSPAAFIAGSPNATVYYVLAGDRVSSQLDDKSGVNHYNFTFDALMPVGDYQITYHKIPLFRSTKFSPTDVSGRFVKATATTLAQLRAHMGRIQMFDSLSGLSVSANPALTTSPTLYLRLNGQNPAFAKLEGGVVPDPVEFRWFVGAETKWDPAKTTYRYRIWPLDDDYGPWVRDQAVRYHFLQKGALRFSVQAKYEDRGTSVTTQAAEFAFELPRHLVAQPEALAKGAGAKPFEANGRAVASPDAPNIAFETVYGRSRALIVGVHRFSEAANFADFDKRRIEKDIQELGVALSLNGFEVTELIRDRLSRQDIMGALEKLVNETAANDRLFIYFSTHGFPDPAAESAGFLATSDCSMAAPSVNCISIADVERQAGRALNGRGAKQVLVALDSCFSGLGVVSKSPASPNFARLATKPGAYMLTAGMADQTAQIDPDYGMSTFTYFLVKGLKGEAERYDRGGIITLTDLYNYVQYNVASRTRSSQIPMLGRLEGEGEMLFKPKTVRN